MGQRVAYGTLLSSCSYNTYLQPKYFYLLHQLGGHMLKWERSRMIALFPISLQAATLRMGHTQDHIHFELNKVL